MQKCNLVFTSRNRPIDALVCKARQPTHSIQPPRHPSRSLLSNSSESQHPLALVVVVVIVLLLLLLLVLALTLVSHADCTRVHSKSTPALPLPTHRQPPSISSLPFNHRSTQINNDNDSNDHRQSSQRRSTLSCSLSSDIVQQPKHHSKPTTSTPHVCPYTNVPTTTWLPSSRRANTSTFSLSHSRHSNNKHPLANNLPFALARST